jgi:hypothetical protein
MMEFLRFVLFVHHIRRELQPFLKLFFQTNFKSTSDYSCMWCNRHCDLSLLQFLLLVGHLLRKAAHTFVHVLDPDIPYADLTPNIFNTILNTTEQPLGLLQYLPVAGHLLRKAAHTVSEILDPVIPQADLAPDAFNTVLDRIQDASGSATVSGSPHKVEGNTRVY